MDTETWRPAFKIVTNNKGVIRLVFLPEKVVVEPDVSVTIPLQPRLALPVTGGHGAGLDAAEVAEKYFSPGSVKIFQLYYILCDPSPEVVDVVVLHRHHPVSVALLRVKLSRSHFRSHECDLIC